MKTHWMTVSPLGICDTGHIPKYSMCTDFCNWPGHMVYGSNCGTDILVPYKRFSCRELKTKQNKKNYQVQGETREAETVQGFQSKS